MLNPASGNAFAYCVSIVGNHGHLRHIGQNASSTSLSFIAKNSESWQDFPKSRVGTNPALLTVMRLLRHSFIILTLYGIGLLEAYFLPRYGIEYFLAAIGVTVFSAGLWMRKNWER